MIELATIALAVILIAVGVWAQIECGRNARRLAALRRNAFVTNEKGHRVRYSEASAAVRARAEK